MAKSPKREIGDVGEGVVKKYLEKHRYFVVTTNYWRPWGEIDIVATKDEILHFIEVKSATLREGVGEFSRETIRPEENMHPAKIKKLHRVIQTYLIEQKIPETTKWQLDLACVFLNFDTKRARVELLENIII